MALPIGGGVYSSLFFGHSAWLTPWITPFLSRVVTPFFCSTRAASILPSRPHIAAAVARSGGQGRRFFSAAEGLSLTDASTAQPAEACLAGQDRPADSRRARHRRDRAADRNG